MNHYMITIAYDGIKYHGWQRLTERTDTIQYIIENALREYTSETIKINGSGRTDAGVSALAQTADFKCNYSFFENQLSHKSYDNYYNELLKQLNNLLPDDIAITAIAAVKDNFHARKSSIEKHYRYSISLTGKNSPFNVRTIYNLKDSPIQLEANYSFSENNNMLNYKEMTLCADILCGTFDYSAFTTDKRCDYNHIRTVNKIQIHISNGAFPVLTMDFYGNGFLYNMVRIMAGTIILCGLGQIKAAQIPDILSSKERKNAGPTLPSNGLMLVSVKY